MMLIVRPAPISQIASSNQSFLWCSRGFQRTQETFLVVHRLCNRRAIAGRGGRMREEDFPPLSLERDLSLPGSESFLPQPETKLCGPFPQSLALPYCGPLGAPSTPIPCRHVHRDDIRWEQGGGSRPTPDDQPSSPNASMGDRRPHAEPGT